MNTGAERRSISEVNGYRWMLLPSHWHSDRGQPHLPSETKNFQGLNFHYRQRNPIPYVGGDAFMANLHNQWVPVRDFGPYTLFEHRGGASVHALTPAGQSSGALR